MAPCLPTVQQAMQPMHLQVERLMLKQVQQQHLQQQQVRVPH
jgi:hypothetical protein